MKGIILAGGQATRLYPVTKAVNKQLLPVYDKPMIFYPLTTLMKAGIKDILVITSAESIFLYKRLLSNGSEWNINISYAIQEEPKGIAEAFIIGKEFIEDDNVCLILGDNIFCGGNTNKLLKDIKNFKYGANVYGIKVNDPERYGVVEFDKYDRFKNIIEKPKKYVSSIAVVGLYVYDNSVINKAENLKPSARGELEITDINNLYIKESNMLLNILNKETKWFDAGTHDSLLDASNYIREYEQKNNMKVGDPNEI